MNRKEFNVLLTEHQTSLEPFSYSLTHDESAAKDLIQDTLYRALLNYDKFQEGTNMDAWLYTIMRNIFINNYRRRKKFEKVSSEVPQDIFMFQKNKVARNEGPTNFGIREIKNAINRLPEIFKKSFEMYYKGYKYKEIADMTQEPLGTIKSRIHFARKMLAKEVKR